MAKIKKVIPLDGEDTITQSGDVPVLPADFKIEPVEFYRTDTEYEQPYSPTLMNRANQLAEKVWGTREEYLLTKQRLTLDDSQAVVSKNTKTYDKKAVAEYINDSLIPAALKKSVFGIGEPSLAATPAFTLTKKLKRLARKYTEEDLFNDDIRENIINTVLHPHPVPGIVGHIFTGHLSFRFPVPHAVTGHLLSEEDVNLLESVLNNLSTIRGAMTGYSFYSDGYSKEQIAKPINVDKGFPSPTERSSMFLKLRDINHFFVNNIPYEVRNDFLDKNDQLTKSSFRHVELQRASVALRDTSLNYIQETVGIAELFEALLDYNGKLLSYFHSLNYENYQYFDYLNRIGMTYDKLVEESATRINDSGCPW